MNKEHIGSNFDEWLKEEDLDHIIVEGALIHLWMQCAMEIISAKQYTEIKEKFEKEVEKLGKGKLKNE